jgi:hypothetical protein
MEKGSGSSVQLRYGPTWMASNWRVAVAVVDGRIWMFSIAQSVDCLHGRPLLDLRHDTGATWRATLPAGWFRGSRD